MYFSVSAVRPETVPLIPGVFDLGVEVVEEDLVGGSHSLRFYYPQIFQIATDFFVHHGVTEDTEFF